MFAKRIAFLTADSLSGFVPDDVLASDELAGRGVAVDIVPWDGDHDWSVYDLVVLRSTWDYHRNPDEFLQVLDTISSTTKLVNDVDVVRWNLNKSYLLDLQSKGLPVIPTSIIEPGFEPVPICTSTQWIVKPVIGLNAIGVEVVDDGDLATVRVKESHLLQPFVASVQTEGEYSVIAFESRPHHVTLKTPKQNDFRVQEEHGGVTNPFAMSQDLRSLSRQILDALSFEPTYARIDLVRYEDQLCIMELELIEPSLYLGTHPEAASKFSDSLIRAIQ